VGAPFDDDGGDDDGAVWILFRGAGATAVEPEPLLVTRPSLSAPRPNPFNAQTIISFEVPELSQSNLRIYDVSGRLVRVLLRNDVVIGGRREIVWDGRDDAGRSLASGVYFCRLIVGDYGETKRMVLVK